MRFSVRCLLVAHFFVGVKNMNYEKTFLESLSLVSLRDVGKSIGVKAPTGLTKKELLQAILDVQEKKVEPHFSKRGRPPLKTVDKTEFVQVVKTIPDKKLLDNIFDSVLDEFLLKLKKELLKIYKNIE